MGSTRRRKLGSTELEVFPLCLGGNVFGWNVDEAQAFAVLDAYAAAGGNFIDTADVYSRWADGVGGGSERIIGNWMASRGNRDAIVLATKVGQASGLDDLSAATIERAAAASLERLQTDRIDLYYAHFDREQTPLEETLVAFDALVRAGKVRYVAASNYSSVRLAEALATSDREGLARYAAIQPHYNLVHRTEYEGELETLCTREGLGCMPYFALAQGFLTGKYQPGTVVESERADEAAEYLTERGLRILAALTDIAAAHQTSVAPVALAWLAAQPTVVAPIASVRTPEQLAELVQVAGLELNDDELERLDEAST